MRFSASLYFPSQYTPHLLCSFIISLTTYVTVYQSITSPYFVQPHHYLFQTLLSLSVNRTLVFLSNPFSLSNCFKTQFANKCLQSSSHVHQLTPALHYLYFSSPTYSQLINFHQPITPAYTLKPHCFLTMYFCALIYLFTRAIQ